LNTNTKKGKRVNLIEAITIGIGIGGILYIPIGPNGLCAFSSISTGGYRGVLGTGIGSSLSCFTMVNLSVFLALKTPIASIDPNILEIGAAIFLTSIGLYYLLKQIVIPGGKQNESELIKYISRGLTVGMSNPKSFILFPTLLFSFVDSTSLNENPVIVLFLALGACLASISWWALLYKLLRLSDIKRFPLVIEKVSRLFATVLILTGSFRIITYVY
jgi:threonine/homoserine/homoserine lactone efflux protein